MNAQSTLIRIFQLMYNLDEAPPDDAEYIQKQIDEQLGHLQCITKEPMEGITRVIKNLYPLWMDGKFPELKPGEDGEKN